MSPAIWGDSADVPDSQHYSPMVKGNCFNALVGLRDTESLVNFDHDSISTASAALKDKVSLPSSIHHTAEVAPFRRLVQLIKLGKVQLSDYYQDLGSVPSGSWLYSTEKVLVDLTNLIGYVHEERSKGALRVNSVNSKNVRLGNTVIKKLDDMLKEIARISPDEISESQQCVQQATRVLLKDDMDFTSDADSVVRDSRDHDKEEPIQEELQDFQDHIKEEFMSNESQEDVQDRASTPKSPIKRRSRSTSFHEVPRSINRSSIDRSSTAPAAEPDSTYTPSWPNNRNAQVPLSDRVLRSHDQRHDQHAQNPIPSIPSIDIPLPFDQTPPVPSTQTHALSELETLRQMAAQKEIKRQRLKDELLAQQKEHVQLEHLAAQAELLRQEKLSTQETLVAQERARIEEATLKQLELDKLREQRPVSPSIDGTPKFQSEQLRIMYEQFQRNQQHRSDGVGTSKQREPTFSSNFGDLQNTVNAPTLRVVKVKEDYFFAPLNTDHDDYFNWVAHQSLVLLQESPRNHFSLHLFLLFIKGLIDEAGPLLPNITIEVKQGKPEALRAKKPVTFVDLSQEESGFIDVEKLYPRTMDQPRINDVEIIDVLKEKSALDIDNEEAKDFEMGDDNVLDEHRRKRDELLNNRKWYEMPPPITSGGDSLPVRPATRRNITKPESLPPYIPPPQGAPDFLDRYGPPPVVNKNMRPRP
ncbi:hypothetical protein M378DRAFT_12156, partial [Amanita muscaria Koide BX008]